MKLFCSTIALALGALSFQVSAAGSPQAELKQFVDGVDALQADFSQVQTDERGKQISSSTGHMWLSRPGRFRWAYRTPYQQLMVCDGRKIWLYDPDLAQVTVRSAGEALQGTPAALLSQRAALSDQFTLEDAGSEGAAQGVRLKPKTTDSDFKSITLWLIDGVPSRMQFLDHLGGSTNVMFSKVEANQKIDDKQFRFDLPKGVEVVDATAPAK